MNTIRDKSQMSPEQLYVYANDLELTNMRLREDIKNEKLRVDKTIEQIQKNFDDYIKKLNIIIPKKPKVELSTHSYISDKQPMIVTIKRIRIDSFDICVQEIELI